MAALEVCALLADRIGNLCSAATSRGIRIDEHSCRINPVKCPKCSTEAPSQAKFCPRCHAPLSFACPSCGRQQDHGGSCDHCGLDFLKYATALVSSKKAETKAAHERSVQRSTLFKSLLLSPFIGGIPLIRRLLRRG